MPTLVMRGLHGELPSLVTPSTARDYIYVDDVVDATIAAAANPGQEPGVVYNVGTCHQTSLREVVDLVRAEMGIELEPVWGTMAPRTWDTDVWVADIARIRAQLGWEPRFALPEGFRLLISWLRDHGDIRDIYASISRL